MMNMLAEVDLSVSVVIALHASMYSISLKQFRVSRSHFLASAMEVQKD